MVTRTTWYLAGAAALGALLLLRRRQNAFGEVSLSRCEQVLYRGPKGVVTGYVGPTGRCQPCKFLDDMQDKHLRKRIYKHFDIIVNRDPLYWDAKFFPAKNKPLWKLKEFDHRLYGGHEYVKDGTVRFVVTRGFVKDKTRSLVENDQVEAALKTYQELQKRRAQKEC